MCLFAENPKKTGSGEVDDQLYFHSSNLMLEQKNLEFCSMWSHTCIEEKILDFTGGEI